MSPPLLQFEGIGMAFGGVNVLRDVSFAVRHGTVTGLVGENGAGKSTLMNILGGNLQPGAGAMRWEGRPCRPANPREAAARGIAFIHQELNLFPNLTIAENLFLDAFPRRRGLPWVDREALHRQSEGWLREVGLERPASLPVDQLPAGERQLLEIAKAIRLKPRLIILDEPTTSLSVREAERLFALIGRLRARGIAMIYISHALSEVFRLCDRIVVLRDGEVVGQGATAEFDQARLVALMVGRSVSQLFPGRRSAPRSEPLLEVRGLRRSDVPEPMSFTLHRGEVLGVAGLMGSGRTEIARMLFGLDRRTAGEVLLDGRPVEPGAGPIDLIRRGAAFLTEDRRAEGIFADAQVVENLELAFLPRHARGPVGWIACDAVRQAVADIRAIVQLDAKAGDRQPAGTLSGGNQQKLLLGRWLLCEPRLFLLDEPTRGIDVGAKHEIYRLILELADSGHGLLVISSELEELLGLCDRLLVLRSGRLVDELCRAEFDRERILCAALGAGNGSPERLNGARS